ncbi:hypothetical protein ACW18Z_03410 [Limosilactobacillus fermentum]
MGRFHLFVFTKPQYVQSFGYVGFHALAVVDDGAIMENGTPDVHDYIQDLPHFADQDDSQIAGIVMNANPFTSTATATWWSRLARKRPRLRFRGQPGGLALYRSERYQLVQADVPTWRPATVVPGGDYMVSYATFPAYFLKDDQNVAHFQAALDATLFKEANCRAVKHHAALRREVASCSRRQLIFITKN